jgi:RNA polymerase sigma factor (sigma-70 family)
MEGIEDRYEELFLCALRAARRVLADPDAAADVASEAVARAFVRWRRIEAYALAWVTRVAVNLALDRVRRRPRLLAPVRGVDQEPSLDRMMLAAELARLPRRQREALVLRFLLDLDEEQTARILGVTVGTVHTHVTRGLAHMRGTLTAEYLLGGESL